MKTKPMIFALLLAISSPSFAKMELPLFSAYSDALVYRPIGLVATICGTVGFAVLSPMLAVGSIWPPHDAIGDAAESLMVSPARFTFARPLGVEPK